MERVHILVCVGASQPVELPAIVAFLRKVVTLFLKLVSTPAPALITLHWVLSFLQTRNLPPDLTSQFSPLAHWLGTQLRHGAVDE